MRASGAPAVDNKVIGEINVTHVKNKFSFRSSLFLLQMNIYRHTFIRMLMKSMVFFISLRKNPLTMTVLEEHLS